MTRAKLLTLPCTALLVASFVFLGCPKKKGKETADPVTKASTGKASEVDQNKKAQPTGPAPVIGCDKPEFVFGAVDQGAEVKHTFVVKNTGKGVLKIDRAKGG